MSLIDGCGHDSRGGGAVLLVIQTILYAICLTASLVMSGQVNLALNNYSLGFLLNLLHYLK